MHLYIENLLKCSGVPAQHRDLTRPSTNCALHFFLKVSNQRSLKLLGFACEYPGATGT